MSALYYVLYCDCPCFFPTPYTLTHFKWAYQDGKSKVHLRVIDLNSANQIHLTLKPICGNRICHLLLAMVKDRDFSSRDIWKMWQFLPISLSCEPSEALKIPWRMRCLELLPGVGMGERVPGLSKTTQRFGTVAGTSYKGNEQSLLCLFWGNIRWPSGLAIFVGLRGRFGWEMRAALQKQKCSLSPLAHWSSPACAFWLDSEKRDGSPGHNEHSCVLHSHRGSGWPTSLYQGPTGGKRNALTHCLAVSSPS